MWLLSQHTTHGVAKQQKFISHSSGGWESKIKVQAGPIDNPLLGHTFLVVSHMVEGAREPCEVSFKRRLIPPWTVWLSWLGLIRYAKRLRV